MGPTPIPSSNCFNLKLQKSSYNTQLLYYFGNTNGYGRNSTRQGSRWTQKKLSSRGVNVSEVIRESLQSEVDRLEKEKLNKLAKKVSAILKKIPPEEFAQSVRASRDSR